MENSSSSSDLELSDNKPKCSIYFYVTKDDTIMFEAGWDNKENAQTNMLNLAYLLYGLRHTNLLENSMKSAIKQYKESDEKEYADDMQIILESFEQIQEENRLSTLEPSKSNSHKPSIRPLQAK